MYINYQNKQVFVRQPCKNNSYFYVIMTMRHKDSNAY